MLDYTPSTSLALQLCQPETLHAAWRKVRANKGGPGMMKARMSQPRKIGIIQGSPLSPLLANIYLPAYSSNLPFSLLLFRSIDFTLD